MTNRIPGHYKRLAKSRVVMFSAHKNGVAQNPATGGQRDITFGTEAYDYGGYYDTSTSIWMPPAGPVVISWSLAVSGVQANSVTQSILLKDGAQFILNDRNDPPAGGAEFSIPGHCIDFASGSNGYSIAFFGQSAGTIQVSGGITQTYFRGIVLPR